MGPHGDDLDRRTDALPCRSPQRAQPLARIDEAREDGCRDPEPFGQFGVPLPGAHIQQSRGRGVCALGDPRTRQEESDQVGDQQRDVGVPQCPLGHVLAQRLSCGLGSDVVMSADSASSRRTIGGRGLGLAGEL